MPGVLVLIFKASCCLWEASWKALSFSKGSFPEKMNAIIDSKTLKLAICQGTGKYMWSFVAFIEAWIKRCPRGKTKLKSHAKTAQKWSLTFKWEACIGKWAIHSFACCASELFSSARTKKTIASLKKKSTVYFQATAITPASFWWKWWFFCFSIQKSHHHMLCDAQ